MKLNECSKKTVIWQIAWKSWDSQTEPLKFTKNMFEINYYMKEIVAVKSLEVMSLQKINPGHL